MDTEKINDQKISFLYKAIDDAQAIIRMVDTKAGAIIAFWTIFLTIGKWNSTSSDVLLTFLNQLDVFSIVIVVLIILCIGNSIYLALLTLLPMNAPSNNINDNMDDFPKDLFYIFGMEPKIEGSSLYFNMKTSKLSVSTSEYAKKLNLLIDAESISKVLSYELLKVSFIRNMKLSRINNALKSILRFLQLVIILFVYTEVNRKFISGGVEMPQFYNKHKLFYCGSCGTFCGRLFISNR